MESNEFDGAFKKKEPVRAPRRRRLEQEADEDADSSVPVGGAKKSGWGDMDATSAEVPAAPAPRRRRNLEQEEDTATETRISHNPKHDIDSDDDGPSMMIPDLDEEQAEDITRQVAEPAKLKSSRVQTIKELDQDIDRALPPASEIGVDLSALMNFLSPQEQVQEEDEPWDYDQVLSKLASEMAMEGEDDAEEAKKK